MPRLPPVTTATGRSAARSGMVLSSPAAGFYLTRLTTRTSRSWHSPGLLGGCSRWPVRGHPVPLRVGGLPYFDQVAVGIADVATDLVLVLFGWRQELSTPGAPFGVDG